MASNVFAHHIVKSFLPENYLTSHGELHALALKYEKQLDAPHRVSRLRELMDRQSWRVYKERPLSLFQTMKNLGGYMLSTCVSPRFTAYDPKDSERRILHNVTPINQLDIMEWKGKDHMTEQLRRAAEYARLHTRVQQVPTVASLMPPAIGEAALQAGFREMVTEVAASDPQYIGQLQAVHEAYSAIHGEERAPFEPVAVYIPTRELIRLYWH